LHFHANGEAVCPESEEVYILEKGIVRSAPVTK